MISTIRGSRASRLGLAAHPNQDPKCVHRAFEAGINYFFFYGPGNTTFIRELKLLAWHRDDVILASGSGARTKRGLQTAHRKIRSALDIKQIDIFFAEYVNPGDKPEAIFGGGGVLDELQQWKREGRIRYVGASAHDRMLANRLAQDTRVDVLMHRFNMAHRKAAVEVFPAAVKSGTPIIAFTATRWGTLLEPHPGWRSDPPSAADCYCFCMAQAAVQVVLTAPQTIAELDANLAVLKTPRMRKKEYANWEAFGDIVYRGGGGGDNDFESQWP
ncbi:MAG TPA: aldo/keto reductase [Lacipirellulaceae bacterium]|jgi:aryl-alcohol dehydrogenase-like predicted oxidoreductase|nr:aldo/keto reductase [Lacipirellulaceae bacterium]